MMIGQSGWEKIDWIRALSQSNILVAVLSHIPSIRMVIGMVLQFVVILVENVIFRIEVHWRIEQAKGRQNK